MVDARTTEQRARDRKDAAKNAEKRRREEERDRQLILQEQETAVREAEAEAANLKHQAQIKYAEAIKLNEENKRTALEIRATVAKEEYYHQRNQRQKLDNLSDTNWMETKRHERTMEIERIKLDIAEIEADARKMEAQTSADEIRELKEMLNNL